MAYQYLDSKNFLINAVDEGREFFMWQDLWDNYWSLERIEGNFPDVTVCMWKTEFDMLAEITWHDWIVNGIQDEDLKSKVLKINDHS